MDDSPFLELLIFAGLFALFYFLKERFLKSTRAPVVHGVTIIAARREEDDSRYYYAGCECGWVGENTDTEEEARVEGLTHAPHVRSEVESLDVSTGDEAGDRVDVLEEARWRRRRIAFSVFIWSQLVGGMIGILFSNVSPSTLTIRVGVAGAAVLGIYWVVLVQRQWRRVSGWSDNPIMRSGWSRVLLTLIFGFWLGYTTLVWAIPWAVNKGFGKPGKQWFVVQGWHVGGRSGCSGPRVHGSFVDGPHAFCASPSDRTMFPTGANIFVEGPATILGINTDRMSISRRFP